MKNPIASGTNEPQASEPGLCTQCFSLPVSARQGGDKVLTYLGLPYLYPGNFTSRITAKAPHRLQQHRVPLLPALVPEADLLLGQGRDFILTSAVERGRRIRQCAFHRGVLQHVYCSSGTGLSALACSGREGCRCVVDLAAQAWPYAQSTPEPSGLDSR